MINWSKLTFYLFINDYSTKRYSFIDGRQQNKQQVIQTRHHRTGSLLVCLWLLSVCYFSYRAGVISRLLSTIRNIHVEVFVFVCDLEGAIEFGFDWWSLRIFMLMLLCYFTCRNNLSISTDLFFPVTTSFDLWIFLR